MRSTAVFAGGAALAGVIAAATSHKTWNDSENASPKEATIGAGFALPLLGALGLAVSPFLGKTPAGQVLRAGGLGAIAGGILGWGIYNHVTGHKVIALPWDADFKTGRVVQTKWAEFYNDHFHTSKPAGKPLPHEKDSWTFAVVSDTGSGTKDMEHIANNIDNAHPSFIVHGGDLVQTKGTESEWREKFDPKQYFGKLMDKYDVYPVIGNHELLGRAELDPFFDRFPELSGRHWYKHSHDGIDFFMLDSNIDTGPGSQQYKWLNDELGKATGRAQIIVMHHPMLRGGEKKEDIDGWKKLGPLLQKHDVELVLNAHQHAYERTNPLNNAGTIQVTTGSGGYGARPFNADQPEWSAYRKPDMGHLEIEVQDDALVGRWRLENGNVDDTWKVDLDAS